jgi:hypothetical protein
MDDELVLRAALRSLEAALSRHQSDRMRAEQSQNVEDLGAAFGSLVECTFWIATLDLWLLEQHGPTYTQARDAHQAGGYVRAMVWARDRHYHQLPFSTEQDKTPFFTKDPNAMFYISPGLVWRSADALAARTHDERARRLQSRFREDYERHAAGQATDGPVSLAAQFFRSLAETTTMLPG